MLKFKKDNTIFLIDFDKTITDRDTTDELIKSHKEELLKKYQINFKNKEIDIKGYLSGLLSNLKLNEEDYNKSVGDKVIVDDYFKEFLKLNYNYRIVSAGTYNNVICTLKKNDIDLDDEKIYSNTLEFKDEEIEVIYPYESNCGFCGICKKEILFQYKKEFERVVFVGDGSSDICVGEYADILFAKKGHVLEKHCKKNDIDFIPYKNFKDIMKAIFLI